MNTYDSICQEFKGIVKVIKKRKRQLFFSFLLETSGLIWLMILDWKIGFSVFLILFGRNIYRGK